MKLPRVVIAGTASGVGKTIISCGIIRALQKDGRLGVQPFKVGPDYIDPSYLETAAGTKAHNLDAWIMGEALILRSLVDRCDLDIAVIEGVMGMYDGAQGNTNFASTYHIASLTKSPVILVLDASKSARSVAATALGFQKFHRNSHIKGVILNRLGSDRHERLCREALEQAGLHVFGAIHRNAALAIESRHLGLVPAGRGMRKQVLAAADLVAEQIDVDAMFKMLDETAVLPDISRRAPQLPPRPSQVRHRPRVAVARDDSFSFYYDDNLTALYREGANVEFFSPITDEGPPECDGMYIGGGYPEVLAAELARNHSMMKKIKKLSDGGMPIYAECGGLMYLTRSIRHGGKGYRMAGVFDAETEMTGRPTLGYTAGEALRDNVISGKSSGFRGHEFHYSRLEHVPDDAEFAYRMDVGVGITNGMDGLVSHNTLASYGHLYFDRSDHASTFVKRCIAFSRS